MSETVSNPAASIGEDGTRAVSAPVSAALKRSADIVLAGLLLILLGPVIAILVRLVKRDGGAAFYAQRRVGRGGRVFHCYKFRTMVPDAEQQLKRLLESDPVKRAEYKTYWKLRDDPRVTDVGRFLRRYSIDELPQLINVLAGEMSLVGPRPRSITEMAHMEARFPGAGAYLDVKPGMTGLWQVSGRNALSLAAKARLDAEYVDRQNFLGDLVLMARTFRVVLSGDGAH